MVIKSDVMCHFVLGIMLTFVLKYWLHLSKHTQESFSLHPGWWLWYGDHKHIRSPQRLATRFVFGCQSYGNQKSFQPPILWWLTKYSIATRKKDLVANLMSTEKGFGHHPMIMPFQMLTKTHYWSPFVKRLKVFNH